MRVGLLGRRCPGSGSTRWPACRTLPGAALTPSAWICADAGRIGFAEDARRCSRRTGRGWRQSTSSTLFLTCSRFSSSGCLMFAGAGAQVGGQLGDLARVRLRLDGAVHRLLEARRGDQLHRPRDLADVADRLAAFDEWRACLAMTSRSSQRRSSGSTVAKSRSGRTRRASSLNCDTANCPT